MTSHANRPTLFRPLGGGAGIASQNCASAILVRRLTDKCNGIGYLSQAGSTSLDAPMKLAGEGEGEQKKTLISQ